MKEWITFTFSFFYQFSKEIRNWYFFYFSVSEINVDVFDLNPSFGEASPEIGSQYQASDHKSKLQLKFFVRQSTLRFSLGNSFNTYPLDQIVDTDLNLLKQCTYVYSVVCEHNLSFFRWPAFISSFAFRNKRCNSFLTSACLKSFLSILCDPFLSYNYSLL